MEGYNQLLEGIMVKYMIDVERAEKVLDRCFFSYEVITEVLNRADEIIEEQEA